MFKPSEKREALENTKNIIQEVKKQNSLVKKINKKQIESNHKKELKKNLTFKEGELKKKISIRKKTISKSFRDWFFNNSEL